MKLHACQLRRSSGHLLDHDPHLFVKIGGPPFIHGRMVERTEARRLWIITSATLGGRAGVGVVVGRHYLAPKLRPLACVHVHHFDEAHFSEAAALVRFTASGVEYS
jgi:hypothetical protein